MVIFAREPKINIIMSLKITLPFISAALLTAITCSAQTIQYRSDAGDQTLPAVQRKHRADVRFQTESGKRLMPPPTGTAEDMVTDPEGEKIENAIRSDISFRNMMGMPEIQNGEALIGEFVVGDDRIWFKPISTYSFAPGYIELEKQTDGTYVAHTPQVFYDQDNYDGTHILAWATRFVLKTTDTGAVYYDAEENEDGTFNTDMKFTYENGILRQADQRVNEQGLPLELLAMTDPDGNWAIYGSGCISMQALPADMKQPTLPEDKVEHEAVFGYKTLKFDTGELVFNNKTYRYATSPSEPDAVYLNVPESWLSDRWIRGTVGKDKSWTFEKQYLGTYVAANMHIWFTPSTFKIVEAEQNGMKSYGMALAQNDVLVFKYDEAKESYFASDYDVLEINASPTSSDYIIYSYATPSVHDFPANVSDPADPEFTSFTPYMDFNNFGMMSFSLPNYDIEGNFMNTEKMFYRVFINQDETEPFVLSQEEYSSLTEDITDVPYTYNDVSQITCYNMNHNLYFFRSDVNNWGIQSVYKDGDVEKKSNVVWNEVSGVNMITTDAYDGETIWYDMQGRRVNNAERGIFIRKTGDKVEKVIL